MAGLSGSDILQIGDEDDEFSRKSAASFRFDSVAVSGRGTLATVRGNDPSYQYYIDGKGITNAARKQLQLLHLAVMEVQDIYENIQDLGSWTGLRRDR